MKKAARILCWILLVPELMLGLISFFLMIDTLAAALRQGEPALARTLASVWFFVPVFGAAAALFITQRRKLPPVVPGPALPAYASPEVYADSTVTFYPEPKDYAEPAHSVADGKAPAEVFFAHQSLLYAVLGLGCGFLGFIPGFTAVYLSLHHCRTADGEKKKQWSPFCRRRAQAGLLFGLAACMESVVLLGLFSAL